MNIQQPDMHQAQKQMVCRMRENQFSLPYTKLPVMTQPTLHHTAWKTVQR